MRRMIAWIAGGVLCAGGATLAAVLAWPSAPAPGAEPWVTVSVPQDPALSGAPMGTDTAPGTAATVPGDSDRVSPGQTGTASPAPQPSGLGPQGTGAAAGPRASGNGHHGVTVDAPEPGHKGRHG